MIITCPQCETRYTADAASFSASGRKVRCSKCGHLWHQAAPEPEPVLAPEAPAAGHAAKLRSATAPVGAQAGSTAGAQARVGRRSWAERLGLIAGWAGLA